MPLFLRLAVRSEDEATVFMIFTLYNCWVQDGIMDASCRDKILLQTTERSKKGNILDEAIERGHFGMASLLVDQFERTIDTCQRDMSFSWVLECAVGGRQSEGNCSIVDRCLHAVPTLTDTGRMV